VSFVTGKKMSDDNLSADLLKGVHQIAEFIDESHRRTYYPLENGLLPAGKLGTVWIASKSKLRTRYAEIVAGGVA
jgi:hypothetical protein